MKHLHFLLLLLLAIISTHCVKETTAKGRVFNYISGKPIANMRVFMTGYDGYYPRDSRIPNPCGTVETLTDVNGEYALNVNCSGMDKVSIGIGDGIYSSPFTQGYFSGKRTTQARLHKHTDIDFLVDSIDGKINFNFQHLQATTDTIFFLVQCNALYEEPFLYCGGHNKIGVGVGETFSKNWSVTAGRYVKYYWSTAPFTKFDAPHIDSIYCARNDSVTCVISF